MRGVPSIGRVGNAVWWFAVCRIMHAYSSIISHGGAAPLAACLCDVWPAPTRWAMDCSMAPGSAFCRQWPCKPPIPSREGPFCSQLSMAAHATLLCSSATIVADIRCARPGRWRDFSQSILSDCWGHRPSWRCPRDGRAPDCKKIASTATPMVTPMVISCLLPLPRAKKQSIY